MESIKKQLSDYYIIGRLFIRWLILSVIIGLLVGGFSTIFSKSMAHATAFRVENGYIVYFLPLGGLIIAALYKGFHMENDRGTNTVLANIHAQSEIPFRMAPLIFISTVITHLFGGSAGREGAALQLGGSIGNKIGAVIGLDDEDRRVMVMCGMSAAFSALFGTPMAAAIFPMEMVSVGVMYYAALFPCVISSVVATKFAATMGISPEAYKILEIPTLTLGSGSKIVILSIICAMISAVFCIILHETAGWFQKYIKNGFLRIAAGGSMIVVLTLIIGSRDYLGAGTDIIGNAINGHAFPLAFAIKMLLTALTLGAGFKGGEIVPSFFVGATLGCVLGQVLGISPSLCAAVGMIGVFCGVTNCPVSSLIISFELFGFNGAVYFLIAVAISYMLSGYYGLYKNQ
ncbi:MAG: chloride channel protein, partial [Clostridiaceae bacterium]